MVALGLSACGPAVWSGGSPQGLSWSDGDPAWSPDGRRIVFVSDRISANGDREAVYVMRADGSGVRRLTHDRASDACPSFSPDGTRIVFLWKAKPWGDTGAIYVMRADGSGQKRLTA